MNRFFFSLSFILISSLLLGQISTTQLNGTRMIKSFNPIINAVPFLLISPDSKQGGMGEVGAATEPDVNSAYWNGSKLAFIDKCKPSKIILEVLNENIYHWRSGIHWIAFS